jgi:hypothetical protein
VAVVLATLHYLLQVDEFVDVKRDPEKIKASSNAPSQEAQHRGLKSADNFLEIDFLSRFCDLTNNSVGV